MGGNALKTTNPERLPRNEYLNIEREVIEKIKDIVPNYYVPRYFNDKETFGDLDISYCRNEGDDRNIKNEVIAALDSREHTISGNTLSCEYKSFQVDFIEIDKEHYECNKCFLDFSSFGEILGRMVKGHELRYRHNGLYLGIWENHDPAKVMAEIYLTNSAREMFTFLGLNYEEFVTGFEEKKDMFDFLTKCKYFKTSNYLGETDCVYRKKLLKRPVYKEFVDYISDKIYEKHPMIEFYENNKTEYVMNTLQEFNKIDIYNNLITQFNNKIAIKEKYDGKIVEKITLLKGKELGIFLNNFKNSIENFDEYIMNNSKEQIEERIADFYNN